MTEGNINKGIYRFGDFELNSGERTLVKSGSRVAVTPRAFDLLLALVRADGRLLTKETLLDQVWADAIVEEGNLNRTISALRKALGEARGQSRYIETVPKSGYRFIAQLSLDTPNGGRSAANVITRPVPDATSSTDRSYRWLIGPAAFVLLFGALAAAYFFVPRPDARVYTAADAHAGMVRLTENQFNEDHAEWTADNQIRFVRYISNTRAESWVMNADGSNQRRANERIKSLLTGGWSPDGKRVVFIKEGEGTENVYLADSDGANERKLPLSYPPSDWSPDGTKFVYASVVDKINAEIFIYDIETGRSVNISNHPAADVDPLFSPDGREIAFVSSRDGNGEDYIMAVDGSNVRRLTEHPAKDAFPTFSPDGTQIVFDSSRQGENIDIYIKNVNDDSGPVNLTDLPSNEEHRGHCWSPDGTRMVITSDQHGKNNIYVVSVDVFRPTVFLAAADADLQHPAFSPDGTKMVYQAKYDDKSLAVLLLDLTAKASTTIFRTAANLPNHVLAPVFSPDSGRIVFTNRIDGNSEICSMDTAGKALVNLTNNAATDALGVFAPDGRTIFFQSNRDGNFELFNLFRMNADGSDQRRLMEKRGYEFSPVPFLSGNLLIFSGDRQDGLSLALDIRVVDAEAPENERVLAARRFHDSQPAVSPDAKRVAFVAQSDGNREIYVVNADGSGLVRLTRNTSDDVTPRFSNDGSSLFFSSDRTGRYAIYSIELNR